jgi:hypothetical protein
MNRVYVFKEFSQEAKDLAARLVFPLKVGDTILRPVVYYDDYTERLGHVIKPCILTPRFEINARNQVLIKVQKWADGWVGLDSRKNGLVAFCSEPITNLWTELTVTSIGTKGKCAFVKPVYGEELDLIGKFKRR